MLSFLRINARWIAGGFLLTMFSSFGQTFFIGLSGNEIRERFDLSGGEFGGIYMVATLVSAALLPWLGRTLDVMPGWKVVRFVMPCLAAACLLIAFAPNVLIVVVALFLLRLFGQGMMTHIAYTEIGRWFVASRGRAISLVVPGHQAGEAILPVLFVLVSAAVGWQLAWVAAGATILLLGYPAILTLLRTERIPLHHTGSVNTAHIVRDWTRAEVVRDPIFYLLMVGVLAPPFIGTTIFFHQGYLIDLRGYDLLAFAAAFPVMAATTVVFALVSGALIDRFSATRILPYFLIPMVVATLAAALVTPVWGIYLFMFLFGISYGFTSTLLGALWPEVYGVAHLGGIRALTVSAMVLATALGPGITGALIDLGVGLPQQLLWMALWCVAASAALVVATLRITARQRA
jgi:MFS family permease